MKASINITLACLIFMAACGKSGGGSGSSTVAAPGEAALTAPANNSACLSGVNVDSNDASIPFSWLAAANADSYDLVVKNLLSAQQSTYPVSGTSIDLTLSKGQPYSWYVVSKSGKTTDSTQSVTYKFYVAGNATSSYAPFPATIIAPAAGTVIPNGGATQVTVVFQWSGASVDNDIAFYTIYLDTKNASTVVLPSTTASTTSMSLAAGQTYYWRVVTTDSVGNSSDSGIYSFSI